MTQGTLGVQSDVDFDYPSPMTTIADSDATEASYFAMRARGAQSPGSVHSNDSIPLSSSPSNTMAALTALQYLPIPLLVLSSLKTVVLANEAMGRLLGIDFESSVRGGLSVKGLLQGKSMGELGIDILQNGSPILMSWEVSLVDL
jgi:hypothetical protein